MDRDERERARQAGLTAYQRDAEPIKQRSERQASDTRDFGRFVNRPLPGMIDPPQFDAARAMPTLLKWLPRVSNERIRASL